MQIIYLFLVSLFANSSHKSKPPLKIAVLYNANTEDNLKSELLRNNKATYFYTVTEIKAVAKLPEVAFYKPLIAIV